MQSEKKVCQNCKSEFVIEPEDFLFYEKIKVPAPTWCPECRLQRRMAQVSFASLYKRKCDLCGKEFISVYSADKPYTVYCTSCWWSDNWDPLEYGRDYDFSRPFFEQLDELMRRVPHLGLWTDYPVFSPTSPYNNLFGHGKNCYLLIEADYIENCAYGHFVNRSKDCYNIVFADSCEYSYDLFHCWKDYGGVNLNWTNESNNSAFLWQCWGCQNCFASANLRNKQYYIFNKPYLKEEYFEKLKEWDLGSYKIYTWLKEEARKHWLKYPVKTSWQEFSKDVTGLLVFESKNCQKCFEVKGVEDSRYVSFVETKPVASAYDYFAWGDVAELIYEVAMSGLNIFNIKFTANCYDNLREVQYGWMCIDACSNIFGCVSLREKQYCILNKQYSKEEYEKLVPRIIQQMSAAPYKDKRGRVYRYGEFFPLELSPLAYNESFAFVYFPLSKEEALAQGYEWKDVEPTEYQITLPADDIPDHIRDVSESILKETIGCKTCGRAFRIIPQELSFSRQMNVPLPRQCFFCRLREKLKDQPHPLRFWKRKCQCLGQGSENSVYKNQAQHFHGASHCSNEFEAAFAPDRSEIVYCRECYNAEVI